jgi:hypothetical protein
MAQTPVRVDLFGCVDARMRDRPAVSGRRVHEPPAFDLDRCHKTLKLDA